MDFVEGGDLYSKYSESHYLSHQESRALMKSLLKGLAAIHSKGYVHRDIKPHNILL